MFGCAWNESSQIKRGRRPAENDCTWIDKKKSECMCEFSVERRDRFTMFFFLVVLF